MNIGILSTSANPLHHGHLAIAEWGDKHNYNVVFELTVNNADKGKIDRVELDKRLEQFYNVCRPVVVSQAATFFAKLMFFKQESDSVRDLVSKFYNYPDITSPLEYYFFVGHDTITRIDNSKYYFNSTYERDRLLDTFNAKFIVFNRNGQDDLSMLSPKLQAKSILAEDYTSIDISSTDIRQQHILKYVPR